MRINSTVIAILLILLPGPAVAAPAKTPNGFRQLTWGAPPGKHLKEAPTPPARGMALYQPRPGKPLPPLFGVPVAEEAYTFSQGKFFSASAWIDGSENFKKIKATLIKAYGEPAVTKDRDDNNFRIWKWPDSPVEVRLTYHYKFARATVTYINPAVNPPDVPDSTESTTVSNADK